MEASFVVGPHPVIQQSIMGASIYVTPVCYSDWVSQLPQDVLLLPAEAAPYSGKSMAFHFWQSESTFPGYVI